MDEKKREKKPIGEYTLAEVQEICRENCNRCPFTDEMGFCILQSDPRTWNIEIKR